MHFDVVIAGGGFAGAYAARALVQALGREEAGRRVALIAERNVLVFQPMLAEVAGAALGEHDVVNPLRHFCRGVTVLQARIDRIDWAARQVWLDGGRFTRNQPAGFGHLVLALGSVTDLSVVPGMPEYGWPMRGVADAVRLRTAIINRLEEANVVEDPEVQRRLLTFVVVGGGYTGVETAGQVHDLVREARQFYGRLRDVPLRVVLVHSRGQLLAEIGPSLGDYACRVLAGRGVEVRLGVRVAEVTMRRVHLDDGSSIEAHTVISTVGNAPNPVLLDLYRQLGLRTERGRLPVEPTLRVPGHPQLWAAGDCAAVPWLDRGEQKIAPPTAQLAVREGRQLGKNLAAVLRGDEAAVRPFHHRYLGQLAAIGGHDAVAEVMGVHFRGFVAWWMWRTIYLAKLPGLFRKLRVVTAWTFDLFFTRDIGLTMPPPEEVVRSIHLEAGEPLFAQGDACRAFFYVRRGAITLGAGGESSRILPAGSVIERDELDDAGCWRRSAHATESADLVVFRGRTLELLKHDLALVARPPAGSGA